ncbi:MAG: SOS response-associated peptidase [Pirellulales bacterium]
MCGRFTLHSNPNILAAEFDLTDFPLLNPRYNIAPMQPLVALRRDDAGERTVALLKWGLVPSWADDPKIGNRMINARSETVAEKPAFRAAFRRRRCLVPADGYYEWRKVGKGKQPYLIYDARQRPFAMAGLWEAWEAPDGSVVETCTLLTTSANPRLCPLHDRMPVILAEPDRTVWLDPHASSPTLQALLRPAPEDVLEFHPVSTLVNSPLHESAECLEPVPPSA